MPHCTRCGTEVAANIQFCPSCGQPQGMAPAVSNAPAAHSGLSENAAATLCYAVGWITGIVFYLIDKRPYVRFHAAQSIVTFGGLHIIRIVLAMIFGVGFLFGGLRHHHYGYGALGGIGVGLALLAAFSLFTFILWIVCMVKASQGQKFMLPLAGEMAENMAR